MTVQHHIQSSTDPVTDLADCRCREPWFPHTCGFRSCLTTHRPRPGWPYSNGESGDTTYRTWPFPASNHADIILAAPLPKFDTIRSEPPAPAPSTQLPPPTLPPQATGPPASPSTPGALPIRVPALSPDKVATYSSLFEKSGAENGFLSGLVAKQIFESAGLPNDVLGKIWAL